MRTDGWLESESGGSSEFLNNWLWAKFGGPGQAARFFQTREWNAQNCALSKCIWGPNELESEEGQEISKDRGIYCISPVSVPSRVLIGSQVKKQLYRPRDWWGRGGRGRRREDDYEIWAWVMGKMVVWPEKRKLGYDLDWGGGSKNVLNLRCPGMRCTHLGVRRKCVIQRRGRATHKQINKTKGVICSVRRCVEPQPWMNSVGKRIEEGLLAYVCGWALWGGEMSVDSLTF